MRYLACRRPPETAQSVEPGLLQGTLRRLLVSLSLTDLPLDVPQHSTHSVLGQYCSVTVSGGGRTPTTTQLQGGEP